MTATERKRRRMYKLAVTHMGKIERRAQFVVVNHKGMTLNAIYHALEEISRDVDQFARDIYGMGEWCE